MITQNGRPSRLGMLYFEQYEGGGRRMKFCVGYCPNCKTKIGLTKEELEELAVPSASKLFVWRLLRAKIIVPR
jgi:hypothetical protein